jgi:hypothetical protein
MRRKAAAPAAKRSPGSQTKLLTLAIAAGLIALTFAVFAQLSRAEFVAFDDPQFVTGNPHVTAGLSGASLRWALTSAELGYYPLTWLSHMADVQFFGFDAGRHHIDAVLLHVASAVILFAALLRLLAVPFGDRRGRVGVAAFVSALFAIHPMHVESVAWISERKDTLSALLGFAALLVYAKRPRHWLVAVFLAASLLAKQMLVTLPLVLLALDFWPLKRTSRCTADSAQADASGPLHCRLCAVQFVREKLPLFIISIAGTIIAVAGQRHLTAIQPLDVQPLGQRVANALVSYALYLGKLFVPIRLAVFYPLVDRGMVAATGSAVLLIAITWAAWRLRQRAPYVLTGWTWFIVTLLPVIGIVQIGPQAMADRYSYIPSVGIFIALACAAYEFLPRKVAAAGGILAVAIFAVIAFRQTTYWHDTRTLFTHAIEVTGPNPVADYMIGQSLATTDPDAAIPPLRRAIAAIDAARQRNSKKAQVNLLTEAHISLGTAVLVKAGLSDREHALPLIDEAEREYRIVLALQPNDPLRRAQYDIALAQEMRKKVLGRGDDAESMMSAGANLLANGRVDEAVTQFRRATESAPMLPEPHVYLGTALARAGRKSEAVQELRTAEALNEMKANLCLTQVQHLPFDENNLRHEIARLSTQ